MNNTTLAALLALCSPLAMAQTAYEKIEVGTLLTSAGIELGTFVKPIPLPAGEWLVVAKRADDVKLTSNRAISWATPRIYLTLKNNNPKEALLFAVVVSFIPEADSVNWGNSDCKSTNPKVLTDTFGYNSNSLLYVCSYANTISGYKAKVAKASGSTNVWWKANLPALAAYPDEIPDNVLTVNVFGNQYKGRNIAFTFILRAEGNIETDPAYASYVKDWAHTSGLSLAKVLDNSKAEFALPAPYVANP